MDPTSQIITDINVIVWNNGNVRDVEKPEEVTFENIESTSKSKLVTFSASSMLNAASGTVMVKLSNAFKEFEISVFVWYHIRFNKC